MTRLQLKRELGDIRLRCSSIATVAEHLAECLDMEEHDQIGAIKLMARDIAAAIDRLEYTVHAAKLPSEPQPPEVQQ